MKLSIIIPAYNEEKTLEAVIRKVDAVKLDGIDKEIVIVDDCSSDSTPKVMAGLNTIGLTAALKLIYHDVNQGKGAAIAKGIKASSGDIVIIQDADMEYDPNDYARIIAPILDGRADYCYGVRFAPNGAWLVQPYWHTWCNKVMTWVANIATGLNMSDIHTCYKAFRADVIKGITITEKRFGGDTEITIKLARKHLRMYEVPASYIPRTLEEGKKVGLKDAFRCLWCIFKFTWWQAK